MNTNHYTPQPVDTKDVQLPQELETLVEAMAKNVHEVWAQGRMAQGWEYGENRDDVHKTHPCLIPYEELPESEKEYDLNTSIETLRFIINQGFRIVKNGKE